MYIEKLKSPADLKALNLEALQVVAAETRDAVLNRVSQHGGHIGPNLGFVEATVALHYVFDAPKDKFVFDVSHQTYPHKVLTGRAFGFLGTLEDMDAISGYSSPTECPEYDNFEIGHSLVVTLEDGCTDGGFGQRIAAFYGPTDMKVWVGGIKKDLYDRFDLQKLLADNHLLDEQIVEQVLKLVD